jgi:surface polysaccharide O-acyltransferase-like enzyme
MGRDKGWIDEIDFVRVVALLAVISIHVGAWVVWSTTPPSSDPTAAVIGLARFSVPAFVVLSGLVLYRGHLGRPRRRFAFIQRRLSRVVLPWFCWAPVFLAAALIEGKLDPDLGAMVRNLILGPGHLYFLVLIAQLYVVMLVAPRPGPRLLLFTIAALGLQLGFEVARTMHPQVAGPAGWVWTDAAPELAPFWIGYFALGWMAGSEYDRLRRLQRFWPLALAVAGLAGAGFLGSSLLVPAGGSRQGINVFFWPSLVPLTVALTLALVWLGTALRPRFEPFWPAVRAVSRHSLGIYIAHVLLLPAYGEATWRVPALARIPLLIALSLASSYVVVAVLARSRLGAAAVGETRPPPGRLRLDVGANPGRV